jgi:predicted transcriptional regulator
METRMLAAHIPLPLAEKLEELSEALDCSRDAIVAQAIAEWIDREEVRRLAVLRMLARADALFVVEHHRVIDWADSLSADGQITHIL